MTAAAPALADSQLQVHASFLSVVELIRQKRDMLLLNEVETGLRLVRYAPGRIEFEPAPSARPDLASRLGQRLQAWTGARWAVSVVSSGGAPTIAEAREADLAEVRADAAGNPLVQAVLAAFPGARISDVRSPEALTANAAAAALPIAEPEMDDDWDPFEE
jgi:DNA polymerase-3 subunit gamma/tau